MLARLSLDVFAGRLSAEPQLVDETEPTSESDSGGFHGGGAGKGLRIRVWKVIDRLLEAFPGCAPGGAFSQSSLIGRNVVGRPVVPSARWRIGIITEENEAASLGRCAAPFQWRRHILAVAGKATWDRGPIAKAA